MKFEKTEFLNRKNQIMVFVEDHCFPCERLLATIRRVKETDETFDIKVWNRNSDSVPFQIHQVFIVPAVFINGRLQFYGEVSVAQFRKKLQELT